ncbi:MAG: ATP-dependent carboxylate-amine ligase [Gammaproteobacteria bacterium]|nr:ATP-dependent carboxylate-amine ligase [Gammaproteobacteria bacterium]
MLNKPLVLTMLETLCAEINATVIYEKEFGYAGYILFEDGRKSMFRGTSFNVNGQGASAIAKDKYYCSYFLREAGFNVPTEILVYAPSYISQMEIKNESVSRRLSGIPAALSFSNHQGFPLYIKPNDGTEGKGVLQVKTKHQLEKSLEQSFEEYPLMLVQKSITGRDYRLVVFNEEILSAYERIPFRITGNAKHSVDTLIQRRLNQLREVGQGRKIDANDPRIDSRLLEMGIQRADVIEQGKSINLLSNANLSSGGEAVDITDKISHSTAKVAIDAANALGLTLAGIDILCDDALVENGKYTIIEVNSAPVLNGFANSGDNQNAKVMNLYRKLLNHLNKT